MKRIILGTARILPSGYAAYQQWLAQQQGGQG